MSKPSTLSKAIWTQPDTFAHTAATKAQKRLVGNMFGNGRGAEVPLHLISHETILPAQFWDEAPTTTPELRLFWAVLWDALNGLLKYGNKPRRRDRRLYAEDWAWFTSNDAIYPLACIPVCEHLGLDPDAVRRGVAAQFTATGKKPEVVVDRVFKKTGPAQHIGGARVARSYATGRRRVV